MPRLAVIISTALLGGGLAACSLGLRPTGLPSSTPDRFGQLARLSPLATGQESSLTPSGLDTPTPYGLAVSTLTGTPSPFPEEGGGPATQYPQPRTATLIITCDQAAPGNPIDITVPDNSAFKPGEYFSKTWRLRNSGTCSWTRQYAAVFFSGDLLAAPRSVSLNELVAPSKTTDITVDMMAPLVPGTYQGNWKLRDAGGTFFGIGPGGNSPFWVRIVVIEQDTPTPTALPTTTSTPAVYAGGLVSLAPGDSLDLDTNQVNASEVDLVYSLENNKKNHVLTPQNGAHLGLPGQTLPQYTDCLSAPLTTDPLVIDGIKQGAYFCYKTSLGLPGWARLVIIDLKTHILTLEILTWAIP